MLGIAEEIEIEIENNVMYVVDHHTGHDKLGTVGYSYKELLNALLADGELRAIADYPRVEQLLDSLPASSVVNETTWQTTALQADGQTVAINKGKWMREGLNFRVPDLRNQVLKGIDDSLISGRYEHQEIMGHDHDLRGSFSYGGYDGGGNTFFRIRNLTDGFDTASKVVSDAGGSSNIVNNTGLYPQIYI